MTGKKRYVLVEGHGEVEAMGNLLARLSLRIGDDVPWSKPLRWPNLHQWEGSQRGGVRAGVEFVRAKGDVASLLLIRDADEACPRDLAPEMTARIRSLRSAFPVAYVLFKPEYEVLFLPCVEELAGKSLGSRAGLVPGTQWDGDGWEARRGIKEWLSNHFPKGKAYKPTVDQLPLTRMLDLDRVAEANVPCFGTLERALGFLVRPEPSNGVYP